ncbi:uncharacterized protein KY384_006031 [Bacidia gigantensis]|uniref:uncharacterized protein n=1 Tax=Bacidia gigantensis TaxID=2732470 RepID=UPI001D05690B|nr:uncharacterized protein KY384_006031 [Bacidia gigantensis]KAG8529395.1 hypothetical protein KY384_006031 [Bacidia gigantensis]
MPFPKTTKEATDAAAALMNDPSYIHVCRLEHDHWLMTHTRYASFERRAPPAETLQVPNAPRPRLVSETGSGLGSNTSLNTLSSESSYCPGLDSSLDNPAVGSSPPLPITNYASKLKDRFPEFADLEKVDPKRAAVLKAQAACTKVSQVSEDWRPAATGTKD